MHLPVVIKREALERMQLFVQCLRWAPWCTPKHVASSSVSWRASCVWRPSTFSKRIRADSTARRRMNCGGDSDALLHCGRPRSVRSGCRGTLRLCAHERFILEDIHSDANGQWDEEQRFTLMFVFRAHCCRQLCMEVQLPLIQEKSFWTNQDRSFEADGPMGRDMMQYRRKDCNCRSLQTSAFRRIPKHICEYKYLNLVRNICVPSMTLVRVARDMFPLVKKALLQCFASVDQTQAEASAKSLYAELLNTIRQAPGLGNTWSKMLMVSIDLRYPQLGLLQHSCEVGIGAVGGLRRLLPSATPPFRDYLARLTAELNQATGDCSERFLELLARVERQAHEHFRHGPLMRLSLATQRGAISAATVQVQLCEWRQFFEQS
jgi:hypothetical protein